MSTKETLPDTPSHNVDFGALYISAAFLRVNRPLATSFAALRNWVSLHRL